MRAITETSSGVFRAGRPTVVWGLILLGVGALPAIPAVTGGKAGGEFFLFFSCLLILAGIIMLLYVDQVTLDAKKRQYRHVHGFRLIPFVEEGNLDLDALGLRLRKESRGGISLIETPRGQSSSSPDTASVIPIRSTTLRLNSLMV